MTSSAKKVALITGAARRIGARLARECAAMGYAVAIHYRGGEAEARALAAELGPDCDVFQAELTKPGAPAALVAAVRARFGRLDLLVNNASTFSYDTVQTATEASWRAAVDSNLTAPIFLIQAFAADGNEGLVVNLLDQKVHFPNPDYFSYTAGKVALAGLTQTLTMALAPRVRVCGIAPGATLPSDDLPAEALPKAGAATPMGVTSSPDDLARALRFIVETPSFAGQILTVDGAESLVGRPRDVAFDETL
ncbi:NAD(P)-dependent dehydrogenase (short-subunit alcohol dehydrogenase family) [Caulobacter ginsengisoli]|uniref:NAD(P)-dependent dehydrogenase (Short-subunit alcohol dehydrogenase family) n=1 Tax=Caulobacter ginsengisoli TaxID=400775 RepID=A0ABU0IVL1_9CAUL|nr:SDR family NAD(P)-dependent oxidoreductase [Caulobacter ginsengisoli]MDQ0466060.1 NAD(P)-dependent dehydrogenase (short-subunit alcohol dehydrogenase family) [Caulobacter ginsengisoli]